MAEERKCCRCVFADYDSGANAKWYCTKKRKHMNADEYCSNYKAKY